MKKFTKIILIIAGSLAALGIVFSGIAAVMGAGWSTIHRKALAGELDFGNWHIGNGVYYAYDQGHGILDHFWDEDYDDWDDDYDDDDFDNDLYGEDEDSEDSDDFPETPNDERDYVTINMPEKSDDEAAEETVEENTTETSEE